jgi:hypothetical protein
VAFEHQEDAGVRISGYGVHGFGIDEDSARKVFDLAKLAGFDAVTGGVPYGSNQKEVLTMLERLGDEYNVNRDEKGSDERRRKL